MYCCAEASYKPRRGTQLGRTSALAITRSDPGDNLDLTRDTPVWAWVQLSARTTEALILEAGEGIGRTATGESAIYAYARQLFEANLLTLIPDDLTVTVRIILPQGRMLARRTANEAFGILEGLSLLGTSGISQPHAATDSLEKFRAELQVKAAVSQHLALCIGHNGLRVAESLGIPKGAIAQAGNWLGALLVEAGILGVRSILLIGYHGKLVKLAGGIFNTSSHIADAKLEILASTVVEVCEDLEIARTVLKATTAEAAERYLQARGIAREIFDRIAAKVSNRASAYVEKYANVKLEIGTILSDRQGQVIGQNSVSQTLLLRMARN
ncbi:MAG: cobalt-precorrin-5B (C(1))-methyltransferase CbiD [Cyanobacteria bacterium J06641_5]